MGKKLAETKGLPNALKKNSLNAAGQRLMEAIYAEATSFSPWGEPIDVKIFFNHADDRDPALGGRGSGGGHIDLRVYYMPANDREYAAYDVIDEKGYLSGRRRLVVRIEKGVSGGDDKWSFWLTSHPQTHNPALGRNNNYGQYSPIDWTD